MPAQTGRQLRLKKGDKTTGVALVGERESTPTFTNSSIDVSDKDDGGYRTLLDDWGSRALDLKITGVLKDLELINIVTSSDGAVLLQEYTVAIAGVGDFEGDFWLESLELGAPHDDALTFSASLMSSGAFVFTAAA